MKIYDRLYKEINFPSIIEDLLNCPGLLRLRDVRMANNQFVAFPSFSTATRYEHSLGVCYLAGLCAQSLDLSEKESLELMIAGLYHDVGTPPFAHAMEEVLQSKFGFDHEINLRNLIIGSTGDFDGEFAQIYQGEGLKLRSVCQSKKARQLHLDPDRIAKIAAGDKNIVLSKLINGDEMDLDNIDNIFRASSAMGIISYECGEIAKSLAKSFIIRDSSLYYNGLNATQIKEWLRIRNLQYSTIFKSVDDFSYQTMIKKAITLLLDNKSGSKNKLDKNSWRLTDSSLTHEYLMQHKKSSKIMQRVLLCKPFYCLGILYVSGESCINFINNNLQKIESVASEYFTSYMGLSDKKLKMIDINPVVANFYPDKRKRNIKSLTLLLEKEVVLKTDLNSTQGALLGFFTPFDNSNYKSLSDGTRKIVKFNKSNLETLLDILSNGILSNFKISIFGEDEDGQNNTNITQSQLGFFGL